jgi:hypothetical protein
MKSFGYGNKDQTHVAKTKKQKGKSELVTIHLSLISSKTIVFVATIQISPKKKQSY